VVAFQNFMAQHAEAAANHSGGGGDAGRAGWRESPTSARRDDVVAVILLLGSQQVSRQSRIGGAPRKPVQFRTTTYLGVAVVPTGKLVLELPQ